MRGRQPVAVGAVPADDKLHAREAVDRRTVAASAKFEQQPLLLFAEGVHGLPKVPHGGASDLETIVVPGKIFGLRGGEVSNECCCSFVAYIICQ